MKDKLIISDLVAECRVGVFEWEQKTPQSIWIDLELAIDAKAAATHDEVRAAVDYGKLVTSVKQLVQRNSYRLLETMAEAVADAILANFATPEVLVRVKKRALPGIAFAAVELTRHRAPSPTG